MIIIIAKKYQNGRWVEFDAGEMYQLDEVITLSNGDKYKVTKINGSKVTLEVLEDEELQ